MLWLSLDVAGEKEAPRGVTFPPIEAGPPLLTAKQVPRRLGKVFGPGTPGNVNREVEVPWQRESRKEAHPGRSKERKRENAED